MVSCLDMDTMREIFRLTMIRLDMHYPYSVEIIAALSTLPDSFHIDSAIWAKGFMGTDHSMIP